MIKPGKYIAKAIGGQWGEKGEKNTPGVSIEFQLTTKEKIFHTLYLTNTSAGDGYTVAARTFDILARLGYSEDFGIGPDGSFGKEALADKEVELLIEEQEYNGKKFTRVKYVNEVGSGGITGKPVQQVLGSLNMKAELAAARARIGAPQAAPKPQFPLGGSKQPAYTENDIPF